MGRTKKDKNVLIAIGVRLEKAQKNAKLTNVAVARALGVTTQSFIAYKNGRTEISYEKAMIFSKLTGTNVLDYLTPDGKTALLNDKVESETTKNGILLDYLRSLGFFCGFRAQQNYFKSSGNDDDLKAWFAIESADYRYISDSLSVVMDRYRKATDPEIKRDYKMVIDSRKHDLAREMPPATLSVKEWDDLKRDIDKAVRDVVSRHVDDYLKKLEAQRLQTKINALTLDISSQDPEKLKNVCDGLQGAINEFMQKF